MTIRTCWLLAAAMTSLASPNSARGELVPGDCAPWPGEPEPLPRLDDPDPVRARWAMLRAQELTELAERARDREPLESHLLWSRVLCLDPGRTAAEKGAEATRPVRVHRPPVAVIKGSGPKRSRRGGDPWSELDATVALYVAPSPAPRAPAPKPPAPPRAAAPDPPLARPPLRLTEPDAAAQAEARKQKLRMVDGLLVQTETRVRTARFQDALVSASRARRELMEIQPGDDLSPRRVRLEVLAATAQVALGQRDAALESFLRAIEDDPKLELDPRTTSPKVLHVLQAARAARGDHW